MKKNILPFLLLLAVVHFTHPLYASGANPVVVDTQESESDPTQPDTYIPPVENYFNLIFEPLGMDYLYNLDSGVSVPFHSMKKFDWRSLLRINAPAVLYGIRINNSRFAFCPGIGFSTLHYAFRSKISGGNEMIYPKLKRQSAIRTDCKDIDNESGKKVLRSAIQIPFIDLLLRFRFNSVLEEPKEGFHSWLGFKFGFRCRPIQVIHYEEYGDLGASSQETGYFSLKPYTWAVQVGMGYHRFGLIGGLHLTSLFQKNQGPVHSDLLRPFSFSIYVDLL